jgi:hypothetical protein
MAQLLTQTGPGGKRTSISQYLDGGHLECADRGIDQEATGESNSPLAAK